MDAINDSKPSARQTENETVDLFRSCVEQLRAPGRSSVVDILYDANGDREASRVQTSRYTELNFSLDGQKYLWKQGFVPDGGLYRVGSNKEDGSSDLSKVDSNSEEYDRALAAGRKIDFDSYPRC